ncbi:hypothetical protein K491DRAFT_598098 [Lophiostoma macrostomum CBS 122681]|uniref:Myb-like domain-containing protein n=1 Tax=Lophiostoma macrostomum CBS 122681 TaxID=1314788 RepID=A0A6A6T9I6_9PLEO|nr:hypothetical protein K491DRAFT_598098 [Lophiostoma macrostomum CBS 122681]
MAKLSASAPVRASSRLKKPTPQPPSAATTPQPARGSRKRGTRSASRDVEPQAAAAKATRRSVRQASVASESEQEGQAHRRTKRRGLKAATPDLTTVDEVETQIALEIAAQTPPRPHKDAPIPARSPGAVSEMSGTTAISSFSMVEAEMLDPKLIQRDLSKLYERCTEFLGHLAPDDEGVDDDRYHIQEMQKPDSDFTQEYRDHDAELNVRLPKFRSEHQQYIRLRAVRRALLGPDRDPSVSQSGLDLVLYLANLLIFTKQMIGSDRTKNEIWDALRELDRDQFPHLFLRSLVKRPGAPHSPTGESSLRKETLNLALRLRTQLAISVLERQSGENGFDPDVALAEVFILQGQRIRGWGMPGFEGPDGELHQDIRDAAVGQINRLRQYLHTDDQSLERGELVDFDGLSNEFPWDAVVLDILLWARLRQREIQAAIKSLGGIAGIKERLKAEIESPQVSENRGPSVPHGTPRKSRTSFGRDRRRSSRKFDPHDTANDAGVNALMARSNGTAEQPRQPAPVQVQPVEDAAAIAGDQWDGQDEFIPGPEDEPQPVQPVQVAEEVREIPEVEEFQDIDEFGLAAPSASAPPQSTADYLKILKEAKKSDKENRRQRGGFFAEQANARRIEFEDGFDDSQPIPGPSHKGKEPQRSSPKKRRLPVSNDDSDDEDVFETAQSSNRAEMRKQKPPVAKKVRIDAGSSAPPSHQPQPRRGDTLYIPEIEESQSDHEAPEMTEEAPPSSTLNQVRRLAKINTASHTVGRERKPQVRTKWSEDEENALLEYMAEMPGQYSAILSRDASDEGYGVLENRTQVNLKDKARNLAILMIKSGAGLRDGFENVIPPNSQKGRELIEQGYEW